MLEPQPSKAALSLATTTTLNAAIRASNTTGGTKNSGVIIDDSNNVTGVAALTAAGVLSAGSNAVNGHRVYGAGSTTVTAAAMIFGSSGAATAANGYHISVDKSGTESVSFGINKNSATGSVPADAAFLSTYGSAGQIAIGRGNNTGAPSSADILINSAGLVTIAAGLTVSAGTTAVQALTATTITASGALSLTTTATGVITATAATTAPKAFQISNTGADFYFGVEGSVAGAYFASSAAYDSCVYGQADVFIRSGSASTIKLGVAASFVSVPGALTLSRATGTSLTIASTSATALSCAGGASMSGPVTCSGLTATSAGAPAIAINTTAAGAANPSFQFKSGSTNYWEMGLLGGSGDKRYFLYDSIGGDNVMQVISGAGGTLSVSRPVILASTLRLGNTYVAGAPGATTGTITIQDAAGTTYRIPVLV